MSSHCMSCSYTHNILANNKFNTFFNLKRDLAIVILATRVPHNYNKYRLKMKVCQVCVTLKTVFMNDDF